MKHFQMGEGFTLPFGIVTERIAWLGQSGSGKSYAAMKLAEQMLEAGAQVVALDPSPGVWWGLRTSADGKSAGYPINVFGGDHGDIPLTPESGKLVAETIVQRGISVVLEVGDFTLGERAQFAIAFAEAFYRAQKKTKRPLHMFLEEAHNFLPQNIPAADAKGDPKKSPAVMLNRFELLARQGRSMGLGMSFITQMPQSVNKHALNQCGTVFAMRTMGTHERTAISAWVADKATDKSQLNLSDRLPTLKTGEAWLASPHFLKTFESVAIGKKETYDSSRTPEFGEVFVEPKMLAAVDVEELRKAMATMLEQSEADDPDKLRKRITELEAALKKKHPALSAAKVETKTVEVEKRVEVPVLEDRDREALERAAEQASGAVKLFHEAAVAVTRALARIGNRPMLATTDLVVAQGSSIAARPKSKRHAPEPAAESETAPETDGDLATGPARMLAVLRVNGSLPRRDLGIFVGSASKSGYFRKMLSQLTTAGLVSENEGGEVSLTPKGKEAAEARAGSVDLSAGVKKLPELAARQARVLAAAWPMSKRQLGLLIRVASASGYFRKGLSQLRSAEMLDENGDMLSLCEAAREAVGSVPAVDFELAQSSQRAGLESLAQRMFDLLLNARGGMTKAEMGRDLKMDPGSGYFRKGLSQLRAKELIDEPGDLVKLAAELFPKSRSAA